MDALKIINSRTCSKCGEQKPISNFRKLIVRGHAARCNECNIQTEKQKRIAAYARQWRLKNPNYRSTYKSSPEKNREIFLRSRFGITPIEYDRMYQVQQGKCAICETHQTQLKKSLCIDHDHATGAIRGLLCTSCNFLLGLAKDRIEILNKCATYLQSPPNE